jgi:hypothetical protein
MASASKAGSDRSMDCAFGQPGQISTMVAVTVFWFCVLETCICLSHREFENVPEATQRVESFDVRTARLQEIPLTQGDK